MTHNPSEDLMEVAGETLEQLAFVFSFPDDADPDAIWEAEVTGARLTFCGPLQGELCMVISSSALPELTANMLGLEEGQVPPVDQQRDALKEALNVICGNLLPRIGGADAVFDIQAPEILEAAAAREHVAACRQNAAEWSSAALSLDEGECQLFLRSITAA